MNLADLVTAMESYYREHRETQRIGQAYFNGLHEVAPEIANAIRGTAADPFYNDRKFSWFIDRVAEEFVDRAEEVGA